jgi:hypothetical protein
MTHWALKGCIERLLQVSRRWVQRAEKNKILWSSKQLAMTAHYPGVAELPFPIQRLIGQELRKSHDLDSQPFPLPAIGDDGKCKCNFYLKYLLPCRHIFYWEEHYGGVLTDNHWARYLHMFEQEVSGMEIYEMVTTDYIDEEIFQDIGAPARRKLEVREILNAMLVKYYELERIIEEEDWAEQPAHEAINQWIAQLGHTTGELRKMGVEQLKEMLCPESQAILSESQQSRASQQPSQHLLDDQPQLVLKGTAEQDLLFHLPEYDFNEDLDFLEEDFPTTEIFG